MTISIKLITFAFGRWETAVGQRVILL